MSNSLGKLNRKKTMVIAMLAIAITMILSVGLTYAYFTSRLTNDSTTLNFGHLEVANGASLTSSEGEAKLIPGATITFAGSVGVTNTTNVDALLRMKFNLTVTGGTAPEQAKEEFKSALITALFGGANGDNMWLYPTDNNVAVGDYLYYAGKFIPSTETPSANKISTYSFENKSLELTASEFGDEFQDVVLTLSITVQAIQAKYVGLDGENAFNLNTNDLAGKQALVNSIYTTTSSIWASLFPVSITLNANGGTGGTTSTSITGNATAVADTIIAPTNVGYTLAGWFTAPTSGTKILNADGSLVSNVAGYTDNTGKWIGTSDVALYAQYTASQYTVTLDKQSGTGGSDNVSATYNSAMPSGATAPTRTGYTFGGYYSEANGAGTQYYDDSMASTHVWDIDSETPMLYAKWTGALVTITLDQQDATTNATTTSIHYNVGTNTYYAGTTGDTAVVADNLIPAKTSATFCGYYTAVNGGGTQYIDEDGAIVNDLYTAVTSDTTLYAKWGESYYLTFSSPSSFTLNVYNNTKHWDGTLEYSTDASSWYTWSGTNTLTAVASSGTYYLYLRGTGNTYIVGSNAVDYRWVLTGSNISCSGNIENLLDYATVSAGNHPTMASNCYRSMFRECTSLTSCPELPATTLADHCYYAMFYRCTGLTSCPELPATTLADYCYFYMFAGCTGIKLSTSQGGDYQVPYRIPTSGTGTTATDALSEMFAETGGEFTGTPSIDTTYYGAW